MLLFSPAVMMLLGTALGALAQKQGNEEAVLLYVLITAYLALPLCLYLGFRFTKPDMRWYARAGWVLLAAWIVAFLNYSIAIGGCLLALR